MAVSQYTFFSNHASLCSRSTSSLTVCVLYPHVLPSSFFQGSLARHESVLCVLGIEKQTISHARRQLTKVNCWRMQHLVPYSKLEL